MKKIKCFIFGHKFSIKENISQHIKVLKCNCCNQEFGINTATECLLKMDNELREAHNELKKV